MSTISTIAFVSKKIATLVLFRSLFGCCNNPLNHSLLMLPLWTSNAAVARPSTTKPRRQGRTLTSSEKKAGQTNGRLETIEQLEFVPKVAQSYVTARFWSDCHTRHGPAYI